MHCGILVGMKSPRGLLLPLARLFDYNSSAMIGKVTESVSLAASHFATPFASSTGRGKYVASRLYITETKDESFGCYKGRE